MTDIRRVIDIILQELAPPARWRRRAARCHGFTSSAVPIACSGVLTPARRGSACTPPAAAPARSPVSSITRCSSPMRPRRKIEQLCREAAEFQFATVCVNPTWVALVGAGCLRGTGVGVCSVVGFPLGATTPDVKQFETRRAIFDGASEIDMVINVGALEVRRRPAGRTGHRGRDLAVPRRRASSAR